MLCKLLVERYADKIVKVIRSSFNESVGMENLEEFSGKDLVSVDFELQCIASGL